MDLREKLLGELDALEQKGKAIIGSYSRNHGGMSEHTQISEHQLRAYITAGSAAIARIAGRESEYFRQLPGPTDPRLDLDLEPNIIATVLGAVTALRDAVDAGLLVSLEQRMRANIHDDFLMQAKELLENRYHVAAMVLIGGVLENHLMKLCVARSLAWTEPGSLSKYNNLLKDKVYTQAEWRRIQSIGDDRNSAAHGQGQVVKVESVKEHLGFAERILTDYP